MSRAVAVAVLMLAGVCALAEYGPQPLEPNDNGVMNLCGRELLQARDLFCKAALPRIKNHHAGLFPNGIITKESTGAEHELMAAVLRGWLRRLESESATRALPRARTLEAQCCYKPCTLEELLNYC